MLLVSHYWPAHLFDLHATLYIGALAVGACIGLFVCTGMIYVCIRSVKEWTSPLTVVDNLVFGCASGFSLGSGSAIALCFAFAVQYAGLIAERWFFFARSSHPHNPYSLAIS